MNDFKQTPQIKFDNRNLQQNQESRSWRKFQQEYQKNFSEPVTYLEYNNSKDLMTLISFNSILFYSKNKKKIIFEYNKEKEAIRSFSLRNDGQLGAFSNSSGYVKLFNVKKKNILKNFHFSNQPIYCTKISSQRPLLIAGDDGGNFKALDFAGEIDILKIQNLHTDFIRTMIFMNEQQNLILTGSLDKTIKRIDINTKKYEQLIKTEYEIENMTMIDEQKFALTCKNELQIWDQRKIDFPIYQQPIANKGISSLGIYDNKLITSSFDNHLKIFELKNYSLLNQIKFDQPIQYFASDNNLKLYSISFTNGLVKIFQKHDNEQKDEENPEEKFQREIMRKLYYGIGNKNESSYQYFNRGIWQKAKEYDTKIGKPLKIQQFSFDKYLRKFQYDKALQEVLKNKNTIQILSLIEELMIREGLSIAIKKLNQEDILLLLKFCIKKIDSLNCQRIIIEVLNEIYELKGIIFEN